MILYLVEHGTRIHKDQDRFDIYKGSALIRSYPANQVENIVIMANVSLTPHTINFILKNNIDTVFLTSSGMYRGRLIGVMSKNIELRILQINLLKDIYFATEFTKSIVKAKAWNTKYLLQRYSYERKSEKIKLNIRQIKTLSLRLEYLSNIDEIRGFEGKIASLYFDSFTEIFRHKDFKFNGRNKRPPLDPINALLSFLYVLLFQRVESSIYECGLDPYVGFFHTVDYGKPSLALDLMEEFRFLVDSLVIRVVNKNIFSLEDFWFKEEFIEDDYGKEVESLEAVYLNSEGLKKAVSYFQELLEKKRYISTLGNNLNFSQLIREQARIFARSINNKEPYKPFEVKL